MLGTIVPNMVRQVCLMKCTFWETNLSHEMYILLMKCTFGETSLSHEMYIWEDKFCLVKCTFGETHKMYIWGTEEKTNPFA